MKRRDLMRELADLAAEHKVKWYLERQRAHEIWKFNGKTIPIPRHVEIKDPTANDIRKKCLETLGL